VTGVNYYSAFIAVASDSSATAGTAPVTSATRLTVATVQFELLSEQPYRFTSEDVIFASSWEGRARADRFEPAWTLAQEQFFGRPRACLRASPLPKQYGWGLHFNAEGGIALVGVGTAEYERLLADRGLRQLRAMGTKRRTARHP
jgi:hypothetical protein